MPFFKKNGREKREAVSAEPVSQEQIQSYRKKVVQKSADEISRIHAAFEDKGLFSHLDEEQRNDIYDVMTKHDYPAGSAVMKQGEDGDQFFVIDQGEFDVYQEDANGVQQYICTHSPGKSFGELALIYGSPRNATVKAKTKGVLWCLDRLAFRCIVVQSSAKKKAEYEKFLEKVPLLMKVSKSDRAKIADALKLQSFKPNEVVVREGDEGDYFYIIEKGEVAVSQKGKQLAKRGRGDYFGEYALGKNAPRIATITATQHVRCLTLSRTRFQRLFDAKDLDFRAYNEDGSVKAGEFSVNLVTATIKEEEVAGSKEFDRPLNLKDMKVMHTLGFGAYGRVQLVRYIPNGKIYAMKILIKSHIVERNQINHVKDEKRILERLNFPFIVNMFGFFQDQYNLYIVMEFVNGGEVYSLLQRESRLPNDNAQVYAAEILLAFQYIHGQSIIYRDLKPENLLIDAGGHMKITDFGLAKKVESRTFTMCGTPDYLAPEIILNKGHNKSADYWAFGILIYEMLTGLPPFYDQNGGMTTLNKILKEKVRYQDYMSRDVKDLIAKLLEHNVTRRFGCLKAGSEDIKNHKWFANIDFDKVINKGYKMFWVPPSKGDDDVQNFDDYPPYDKNPGKKVPSKYQEEFSKF